MKFALKIIVYLVLALITIYFGFAWPNYFLGVLLGMAMGVVAWYLAEEELFDD